MILSLDIFMNLFNTSSMQIECHKLLSSTYYGVSCLSADCKTSKLSTSIVSLSLISAHFCIIDYILSTA